MWAGAGSLAITELGARFSWGEGLAWIGGFSGALATFTPDSAGPVLVQEWIAETGVGWHLRLAPIEFTPYVLVDAALRSVNQRVLRSVALQLGGSARYLLTQHVGLLLDANWRIGAPGPLQDNVFLMEGSGPRVSLGVSFLF